MITVDEFEEFLETFDNNPFKINEDKKFRKHLIDNVVRYTYDHMSLLTAAVLIKKKFKSLRPSKTASDRCKPWQNNEKSKSSHGEKRRIFARPVDFWRLAW